jgi:hypothetical protein
MDRQYLVAALDYRLLVLVQSTRNRKGSFHSVGFDGTLSLLARTSLYRVVAYAWNRFVTSSMSSNCQYQIT